MDVDAIVNAANEHLQHGGGLAAAIAGAGGPAVQAESDAWVTRHGRLTPGRAAVTGAGNMPARAVIHVVGPRYHKGRDNQGLLRAAVKAALDTAAVRKYRTVALPAISAGIFGYPMTEATGVIVSEAVVWAEANPGSLDEIRLVGFDETTAAAFEACLEEARR
jgi:putative ATPase